MRSTSINIGFRPPRIATLVRPGNLEDVAAAAVANTHLWGGVRNPIVPVGETDSPADVERRLAWWQTDLVTVLGQPTDAQTRVLDAVEQYLRAPALATAPFKDIVQGRFPYSDVRVICSHHFETTFRFEGAKSRALAVSWPHDDPLDPYLSVLLGRYTTGLAGHSFRQAFKGGLGAQVTEWADLDHTVDALTPIGLTGSELTAMLGRRRLGIVVGSSDDARALTWFWNLRADGWDVAFWPTDGDEHATRHAHADVDARITRRKQGESQIGEFAHVWTLGELEDQRSALPDELVALLEAGGIAWSRETSAFPGEDGEPTRQWSAREAATLATIEERSGRTHLVAALPPHPFSAAKRQPLDRPQWLVTLSTYRHHDLGKYTLNLPRLARLTPWASRAMLTFGEVRIQDNGISVFATVDEPSLELTLVTQRATIQEVLRLAGLEATTSPAGEATGRIVDQMDGLWGCRPLRLHGLRSLVASGAKQWTFKEAIHHLHDDGAYNKYRNVKPAPEQLRSLIDHGVLQPVLSLTCPTCRVTSAFPLDDIGTQMTCPRCSTAFHPAKLLESATWKYRPSGFFLTMSTHGSLPVILTMIRILETTNMSSELMIDTSHDLVADDFRAEIDCVALWQTHHGTPAMAIAECKGGERAIEDQDISQLQAIATMVRATGVECYIVLATTRRQFTDDERTAFTELTTSMELDPALDQHHFTERRAGPIVLAADQLDYHGHTPLTRTGDLPGANVRGMRGLALDTQAIHIHGTDVDLKLGGDDYLI